MACRDRVTGRVFEADPCPEGSDYYLGAVVEGVRFPWWIVAIGVVSMAYALSVWHRGGIRR